MVAQPKVSRPLVIHGIQGRNPLALSPSLLKQQIAPYKFHRVESREYASDDSKASSSSLSSLEESSSSEAGVATPIARIKAPSSTTAAEVRSKFMNKLGIAPQIPEGTTTTRTPHVKRRDLEEPSYETELNDQAKAASRTSALFRFFTPQSSSVSSGSDSNDNDATATAAKPEKRSVHFNSAVVVYPIPLHTAYSNRIRDTVWTSVAEMEENVARNCLEFAAENWDGAQVVEDQDMVIYHGELVHPVHFAS